MMYQHALDAVLDPVRRRHALAWVAESALPVSCALWLAAVGPIWVLGMTAATVLAEFLLYELVLEPLGWAGPYWEREARAAGRPNAEKAGDVPVSVEFEKRVAAGQVHSIPRLRRS